MQPKYTYGKTTETDRWPHRSDQCSEICRRSEHVGDDKIGKGLEYDPLLESKMGLFERVLTGF